MENVRDAWLLDRCDRYEGVLDIEGSGGGEAGREGVWMGWGRGSGKGFWDCFWGMVGDEREIRARFL